MASEMTSAKYVLMGSILALLNCPTCGILMTANQWTLQHLLVTKVLRVADLPVGFAQASHTERTAADGGRMVALECDRCNHRRGNAPWNPPLWVPQLRVVSTLRNHPDAVEARRMMAELRGY